MTCLPVVWQLWGCCYLIPTLLSLSKFELKKKKKKPSKVECMQTDEQFYVASIWILEKKKNNLTLFNTFQAMDGLLNLTDIFLSVWWDWRDECLWQPRGSSRRECLCQGKSANEQNSMIFFIQTHKDASACLRWMICLCHKQVVRSQCWNTCKIF